MAFVIPEFPLTVNVFTGNNISVAARLQCPGNLAWGKRSGNTGFGISTPGFNNPFPWTMDLLVPALTDIRDFGTSSGTADALEIPAGSGRFYLAFHVDDIGKGFPNEHRCAIVAKRVGPLGFWPTPIP